MRTQMPSPRRPTCRSFTTAPVSMRTAIIEAASLRRVHFVKTGSSVGRVITNPFTFTGIVSVMNITGARACVQ